MICLILFYTIVLVSGLASAPIRFSLGAQVGYTTYKVFEIGDGQLFHGNATVECLMGNSSYMAPEPCGKCKVTPVYCKVGKSHNTLCVMVYCMTSEVLLERLLLTTSFSLICRRSPVRCSIRDGRLFRRMVSGCLHSMAARGSGTVRRALTGWPTSCMMRRLAVSVRQCILWCCSRCGTVFSYIVNV